MADERHVPTALTVVAALFFVWGVVSVLSVVVDFFHSKPHLDLDAVLGLPIFFGTHMDFGVLGIPIFFGLRAFSPGWRTCALVFLWIGLLGCAVAFVMSLFGGGHATYLGYRISSYWASAAIVPMFLLLLWQYRVLIRPDIRILFYPAPPSTASPS